MTFQALGQSSIVKIEKSTNQKRWINWQVSKKLLTPSTSSKYHETQALSLHTGLHKPARTLLLACKKAVSFARLERPPDSAWGSISRPHKGRIGNSWSTLFSFHGKLVYLHREHHVANMALYITHKITLFVKISLRHATCLTYFKSAPGCEVI